MQEGRVASQTWCCSPQTPRPFAPCPPCLSKRCSSPTAGLSLIALQNYTQQQPLRARCPQLPLQAVQLVSLLMATGVQACHARGLP